MNNSSFIQFRYHRNFSEIIHATFAFIRQEIRPLGRVMLVTVGPFAVASALLQALTDEENVLLFSMQDLPFAGMGMQVVATVLDRMVGILAFAVGYGYVANYVAGNRQQIPHDVWRQVKAHYLLLLLTAFLYALGIGLSMLVFLIPGVWVAVAWSLGYAVVVQERADIGEAFSRSRALVQEHWWETCGIVVVLWGMILLLSMIAAMIPSLLFGVYQMHSTDSWIEMPFFFQIIRMLLFVGVTVAYPFLMIIPVLGLSFQYFSLVEEKESVGLMQRIQQVGITAGGQTHEEQY
ncbi:hypothetical protein SAMN05421823_10559 [Catalinimonas alkaloidigena]|uniref:Membrane domain of glycerophosphoryl diester phosphodiesterase n=1 Tax=Catalinimonas alkaloidigena TaxID=1075417 RepID=A0A1G9IP79_9BACT|nr:hypothetical protein [Catalinimonas alkaloidigena]SDL26826.1 hypothetical protein SAMN05421823_10559 [Catalinimonas alkaloidigena]